MYNSILIFGDNFLNSMGQVFLSINDEYLNILGQIFVYFGDDHSFILETDIRIL